MKYIKKIITTTSLFVAIIFFASCSKFLERPKDGQLTKEQAITNDSTLLSFINGAITLVGNDEYFGGRLQEISELLGDQLNGDKFTGDEGEIFNRRNSIFGGTRDNFYNKIYAVIARSNITLGSMAFADVNKKYIQGSALFLRGMGHFELVRLFAQPYGYSTDNSHLGIPIRINTDNGSVMRSSVKDVYAQVISDLKAADTLLPVTPFRSAKYYTPTKLAVEAYLAKVYFQMNDFVNAYKYADMVISSGKFQLDDNYDNRFSLGLSTEGIFVLANQTTVYNPGGEIRTKYRSNINAPSYNFNSQFYNKATASFTDARTLWYSNTLQKDLFVSTKYNKDYFDMPTVHLTEIKLIRAESGAEIAATNSQALVTGINDINDIIKRAYGVSSTQILAPTTPAQSVISTVRAERELEMVAEGNRIQEIKRIGARSGTNLDRRGSPWNCNGLILQFPKGEQDANASFQLNVEGGCF